MLGPNSQAIIRPKLAVNSSISGYRWLMLVLQKAHLPRKNKYEMIGMLCQAFNGVWHCGQ
jgi:hypothetical protein